MLSYVGECNDLVVGCMTEVSGPWFKSCLCHFLILSKTYLEEVGVVNITSPRLCPWASHINLLLIQVITQETVALSGYD